MTKQVEQFLHWHELESYAFLYLSYKRKHHHKCHIYVVDTFDALVEYAQSMNKHGKF